MNENNAKNCQPNEDELHGSGYIKKFKSFLGKPPLSLSSGQWNDDEYSLKNESKGPCHIFYHKKFDSLPANYDIEENEESARLLHQTFKKLKFDVILHEDYKLKDIENIIGEVSQDDHKESDCFILCFLTYGGQTELHARDSSYSIESVLKPFCASSPGKPKLFIFQTIQLNFNDLPTKESTDSGITKKKKRYYSMKIPFYSDFLIASSSFSGTYALTDGQKISNFIRVLCHALWTYRESLDVLSMLTLVNNEMVCLCEYSELKENFSLMSTLTRSLKFA